jgi:hypothetical protein
VNAETRIHLTRFFSCVQWFIFSWFPFRDGRALIAHFGVQCDVGVPLFWHVVLMKDGLCRAFGHAGPAFRARFGVDKQHLLPFAKAIAGADHDAVRMFAAKTGFRHDHGHFRSPDEV